MGLRKYEREIARNRMMEMGIGKVNKRMGYSMKPSLNRKWQRTYKGKKKFVFLHKNLPMWKRILYGDLAEEYWKRIKNRRVQMVRRKGGAYDCRGYSVSGELQ